MNSKILVIKENIDWLGLNILYECTMPECQKKKLIATATTKLTRWYGKNKMGEGCEWPLIISDRRDWREARGKWPLAKNPDRSWWHRHANWKFFWPQLMAPWTTRFGVFLGCEAYARRSVHSPQDHFISPLSLATDVTDATLGASGLWIGTRTGAGGTATQA